MTAEPQILPLVVGVTGHRDILPEAMGVLRQQVHAVLLGLRERSGCRVMVASGMAKGADQIVARVALELGMDLAALLPMGRAAFREGLDGDGSAAEFDALMAHPRTLAVELPDLGQGEKAQYEQLGAVLARRCHVLLALWDGQEEWEQVRKDGRTEDGRGGATHVVHMACRGDLDNAGVAASPLFFQVPLRRAPEPGCHVLQIAAPRAKTQGRVAARGREVAVGACVPLWTEKDAAVAPGAVWETLDERFQKAAGAIAGLNGAVARFGAAERARLDRHVARLGLGAVALAPAAPAGAAAALGALARTQAAVDTLAQKDQRRLMGVWVPAAGVGDMWRRARGFMREQGSWWPPVGVLFLFAAAVPVAVLGFELYAHALHTPVGLVVYAVAVLGGLALARLRVRRSNWQNRFQDHRALAEALRVQLFLALAGVPAAVPDHYLRRPAGELGWIRLALQGPAILALALARAVEGPQREVVRQRWFGDQKTYFVGEDGVSGRMKLHGDAFHLSETRVEQCVGLAAGLVVLLCLNQAALWLLDCGARDTATCDVLGKVVKEWLLVGAATAPALAAFFVISAEKRAHEGHAHAYRSMGTLFGQALEDTAPRDDGACDDGACDDAAFRAVTLETAREALAENAEWLMEHRRRRIDYTPGG